MALREVLARFGIEVDDGKIKNADKAISGLSGKIRDMATLVGGAAIVGGLKSMLGEIVDLGGGLTDTSAKLGIGTGDLQRWQFAAQQTGVEAGALNGALTKFTRTIGEAASGNATAGDAFKALGIDVKNASGETRSSTDLMLSAADGLSKITDPAARARAAIDLFGKSGADLIPLLGQGEEGVRALLEETDKLGGVLDDKTIAALDDAGDASDKFDFAMRGVKAQLALVLLPALTQGAAKLAELVGAFTRGENGATHLKAAMVVLGAVAFATGVKAALPWLGWALLIAGLVLIVDDLWTGLKGGDSVTGRLLDKIFGKGAGASIFKSIRDDVKALWDRMKEAPSVGAAVEEALSTVGESIVRFFVEDIPAALSQAWSDMSADTRSQITALAGIMLTGFGEIAQELEQKGIEYAKALIDGMIEGIKNGTARVAAAVGDMAKNAASQIGKAFETGSPSRLAKRIMGYTADGMIEGSDQNKTRVATAVGGMARVGARALTSIASAGPRYMTQQNTIQMTVPSASYAATRLGIVDGLGEAGRAALGALEVTT